MFDISVVIPVYNGERTVGAAIESVLQQSLAVREVVVVDDGSTDRSAEVVRRFPEDRVRYVAQANSGVASARNVGIDEAHGEWIAFLDCDDVWYTHRLTSQCELLEEFPDLNWVAGGYRVCRGETCLSESRYAEAPVNSSILLPDALQAMCSGLTIWTGTMLVRRAALAHVGGFVNLRHGEDIDLWIRLAIAFPNLGFVNRSLAQYHVGQSQSNTTSAVTRGDKHWFAVIERMVEYAPMLPAERQLWLRRLAAFKVSQMAFNAVRAGNPEYARWLLKQANALEVKGLWWKSRIGARLPRWLLRWARTFR